MNPGCAGQRRPALVIFPGRTPCSLLYPIVSRIHTVELRVRYAETDRMGVVYHANYLVWCEVGRTDFIRESGLSYREMEERGIGLAVSEANMRFHAPARYDDLIRVQTSISEVRSRGVTFDYLILREDGARLVSARTSLVTIDPTGRMTAFPTDLRSMLEQARDAT